MFDSSHSNLSYLFKNQAANGVTTTITSSKMITKSAIFLLVRVGRLEFGHCFGSFLVSIGV